MLCLYYTLYPHDTTKTRQENNAVMKQYRQKMLDDIFTKHTGKPFDEQNIVKAKNGKPYLADSSLFFNLSHTNGLICCGISDSEIGVDCECIRDFNMKLLDKVCTPTEKRNILGSKDKSIAFFAHWVLKESYCKLTGQGISFNFKELSLLLNNDNIVSSVSDIYFDLKYIDSFVIAICSSQTNAAAEHVNYDITDRKYL